MLTQRMHEYEDELERYIPVLMAQAQMFWDQGKYSNVLAVLNQSKEFVSENEVWKLNLAHTFFMLVRTTLDHINGRIRALTRATQVNQM